MPKQQVLFLCTGNSCRSQMAEGFLRQMAGTQFDVYSSGVKLSHVNPTAIQVMAAGLFSFRFLSTFGEKSGQGCPSYSGVLGLSVRSYWRIK